MRDSVNASTGNWRNWIGFAARVGVAVCILGGFAVFVARDLAPQATIAAVLIVCASVAVLLLMVVALIAWIGGAWNQQMINWGAKDAQWFWFDSDPRSFPSKDIDPASTEINKRT